MGLESGWRHARNRWSWKFEDFEKESAEIGPWKQRVEFSTVEAAAVKFFGSRPAEMNWDLKYYKMRRVLGVGLA